MAKQSIGIGSAANDGTGDPLRTAFAKINDNFTELYNATGAGASNNVQISANSIISTDTNGNITLDPNGTGKVIVATAAELRLTDHTDNAVVFLDADGDMQHSANLVYNGTTFTAEDITMAGGTLGTANSNQDLQIDPSGTGTLNLVIASQATVGSAGSATALPGQPEGYLPIKINGTLRVIPFYKQS